MTTNTPSESREQDIEFGDLDAKLAEHEYPATTAEVIEAYGDHELDLPDGARSLRDILTPVMDDSSEAETQEGEGPTYDSAEDVRQMILNMVGSDAVGREGYSDRQPVVKETHDEEESL